MIELTIGEAARAVGGKVISGNENTPFCGVATDTRKNVSGMLFVPLKGENFDGHNYIKNAVDCGAAAVFSEKAYAVEKSLVLVQDTKTALLDLARFWRHKFDIPVVGVTGSAGKTTTKEMIYAVLAERFKTLKTDGNLNNEIGLPLTLFNLDETFESAVIEMGMSGLGEIRRLASATVPHIAVFTNIGTAHVEKLGSRNGIFNAKTEMLEFLPSNGVIVANADDDLLVTLKNDKRTVLYGTCGEYVYSDYKNKGTDCSFIVNGKTEIHLNTIGEHNVMNSLAAFAVGEKLGLSISEIVSGLAKFKPTGLRQNITEKNGIILINDTYNANLSSMKAALDVLASFQQKTGKTVCVLGDMLELGAQSEEIHREVGEYVQKKKISQAFFIGKDAYFIKQGAGFGDWFANKAEFLDFAAKNKTTFENAAILIKASRGMAFEEIAEKIQ